MKKISEHIICAIIVFASLTAILTGCRTSGESSVTSNNTDDVSLSAEPVTTIDEDYVKSNIEAAIDKDHVKSNIEAAIEATDLGDNAEATYTINFDTDTLVMVNIEFKKLSSVSSDVTAAIPIIAALLEKLSEVDGIGVGVDVFFLATDVYGQIGKYDAIYLVYSAETLKKIVWEDFDCDNLAVVADSVRIDNRVKNYMITP